MAILWLSFTGLQLQFIRFILNRHPSQKRYLHILVNFNVLRVSEVVMISLRNGIATRLGRSFRD